MSNSSPDPAAPSSSGWAVLVGLTILNVIATLPTAFVWLILMSKQDHWPDAGDSSRLLFSCFGYGWPPLVFVLLAGSWALYYVGRQRAGIAVALVWTVLLVAGYVMFFWNIQD